MAIRNPKYKFIDFDFRQSLCRSLISFLLLFLLVLNGLTQPIDATNDSIQARKDLIDIFMKVTKWDTKQRKDQDEKKVFFSLMPMSAGTSENGVAFSSVNASFYLGDPVNTNLSNISFYPATNFASYYQLKVFPNLWLSGNSWNIPGKLEYSYISHDSYGLGTNTSEDSLNVINYNVFRLSMSLNREIYNHFFLGVGFAFDDFYNIKELWEKDYPSEFELYGFGTSGTAISAGPVFSILYDNRRNSINPLKGFFSTIALRINSENLGSTYNWKSFYWDTRKYISFSSVRHKTLALRSLCWVTWGEVPYLNLPAIGYDYNGWTGRGYHRGRYRGEQMLYGEAEYRFDLTRNGLWGGVAFVNAQSFTEPATGKFIYVKPAVGFGGRMKFNKYSDSNMTCDIAFGKGSFNWYVSLNEAF
jgi:hypothetical protein